MFVVPLNDTITDVLDAAHIHRVPVITDPNHCGLNLVICVLYPYMSSYTADANGNNALAVAGVTAKRLGKGIGGLGLNTESPISFVVRAGVIGRTGRVMGAIGGTTAGATVGVGTAVGTTAGVGTTVGATVGVGTTVGATAGVGTTIGATVAVGATVGATVGETVGVMGVGAGW